VLLEASLFPLVLVWMETWRFPDGVFVVWSTLPSFVLTVALSPETVTVASPEGVGTVVVPVCAGNFTPLTLIWGLPKLVNIGVISADVLVSA
jgi:hypothetical protein